MKVITYQLAYLPDEVSLCAECVERDDHDCGSLGSIQHGLHDGWCEGARHVDDSWDQEREDASVPTDEKGAAIHYRCFHNHGGNGRVYLACTGHWECAGCGTFVSTETVRGCLK